MEILGGDPGANAGRDTMADEITLEFCDRNFMDHMLPVSALLSTLALGDKCCGVGKYQVGAWGWRRGIWGQNSFHIV